MNEIIEKRGLKFHFRTNRMISVGEKIETQYSISNDKKKLQEEA